MLSTAGMLISIWIRKPRPMLPQWIMNWCSTNLRQQAEPPVDTNDILLGSCPLAWEQEVNQISTLWQLARTATQQIHENNLKRYGFIIWNNQKSGFRIRQPTLMTVSNGYVPIKTQYGSVKVIDIRAMTGHYDSVTSNMSSHMTYSATFDGQLQLINTFTYPGLGKQWGERFHSGMIYILERFANNRDDTVAALFRSLDEQFPLIRRGSDIERARLSGIPASAQTAPILSPSD
ncbi:unnamed protein product [Didymodactylos carnosus]|uniref:Uncharacterized protein n=1 Tax=Didymodactylos carnosus TaxID=1234261 RepID=A0A8S2Q1E5_9BILA|nr:unnamed protein product [Didymodactylos carnosus]CAF4079272.1 unnamed protein product [Didymodactylos carnosus]